MEINTGTVTIMLIGFAVLILTAAIIYRAKNHELIIQYTVRERRQLFTGLEDITHAIITAYEKIQVILAEAQTNTFKYIAIEDDSGDINETENFVSQTAATKIGAIQKEISVVRAQATTMGLDMVNKRIKRIQQALKNYLLALEQPKPQLEMLRNAVQEIDLNYELFVTTVATEKLFADMAVARASLPLYQRQKYSRNISRKVHANKLRIHHLRQQLNHIRNSSQEELLEEELKNIIGIM